MEQRQQQEQDVLNQIEEELNKVQILIRTNNLLLARFILQLSETRKELGLPKRNVFFKFELLEDDYKELIELVTDICIRNDIKKLVWSTNKNDRVNHLNGCNMTVHRDYANKACPGDYLYNLHGQIAAEVNARLNSEEDEDMTQEQIESVWDSGDAHYLLLVDDEDCDAIYNKFLA